MATSQGSPILDEDLQSWYTSLNNIISTYGGGVISKLTVPGDNETAKVSHINNFLNKMTEMKNDSYLGSVQSIYPSYSIVNSGTLIQSNIGTLLSNSTGPNYLGKIKCRNNASNSNKACEHGSNAHLKKAHGTCSSGAHTHGTHSSGDNSHESFGNGTFSNGCNNTNGRRFSGSYSESGKSNLCWNATNQDGNKGHVTKGNVAFTNGQKSHGAKEYSSKSHGTNSSGTCSSGICSSGTNSHGTVIDILNAHYTKSNTT